MKLQSQNKNEMIISMNKKIFNNKGEMDDICEKDR
jgi:hypothetical protein